MGEMTNSRRGLVGRGSVARSASVRVAVLFGALFAFGLGVAGAAPLGQVTEYSSGLNAGAYPTGIAAGPDGNLWFADPGATPAIGRITPGGTITEFSSGLPAGSAAGRPDGNATGPDGNIWFSDNATPAAIGRITPGGTITEFSSGLNAGSRPRNVMAGPDGNVWFTDQAPRDPTPAIGLICLTGSPLCSAADATSHTIHEISLPTTPKLSVPGVIAPGPDGNLWFSDRATAAARIGRITPAGAITEFSPAGDPASRARSRPARTATSGSPTGYYRQPIGRITPTRDDHRVRERPDRRQRPLLDRRGPDGNLWFTDPSTPTGSAPAIGMVDPTTGTSTEFSLPTGRPHSGSRRAPTATSGSPTEAARPSRVSRRRRALLGPPPWQPGLSRRASSPERRRRAGIPIGATVLSGAGTNTLSLSAVTTPSTNAVLTFRPTPAVGRFGLGVCGDSLAGLQPQKATCRTSAFRVRTCRATTCRTHSSRTPSSSARTCRATT